MIKKMSDKRKAKGEHLGWNSTIKVKAYSLKRSPIKKISDKSRKLWEECRKKVFEKWGRKCILCEETEGEIHCHHWNFTRTQAPELKYDVDNIVPICKRHHRHNGADLDFYILRNKIKAKIEELKNE